MKKFKRGFTLIEILIVVALLGAIVIGLLATLDPFQQIRKGTDTTRRNMSSDLYRAFIAYQAVKGAFPWDTSGLSAMTANAVDMTTATTGYISKAVDAGELKNEFVTLAGSHLSKLFVSSTADANGVWNLNVCYQPESKSFKVDPVAIYNQTGGAGSSCGSAASTCYICIK